MKTVRYLVVRSDGEMRVTKRANRLAVDEVAYRVVVTIPDGWATVRGLIELTMPEPPDEAVVTEAGS